MFKNKYSISNVDRLFTLTPFVKIQLDNTSLTALQSAYQIDSP